MTICRTITLAILALIAVQASPAESTVTPATNPSQKPRIIVTSDGEIDDQCSMVRFLLYANEWDIEGLITSSSQYHWHGHKWAGDDWVQPYLDAYAKVHPNLLKHDSQYPAPKYLQARTLLAGYKYPKGRWYTDSAWGRNSLRKGTTTTEEQRREYFKPMWRWTDALQNDFASRADWCVKSYEEANHPPMVVLGHAADQRVRPGATVQLSSRGTSDPDGDALEYRWWQYREAGSYDRTIDIRDAGKQDASFTLPGDAGKGKTVHVICEVTDTGTPQLTRYQRVVVEIE